MKKILIFMVILLFSTAVFGQSAFDIRWGTDLNSNQRSNTLKQWTERVEGLIGGSAGGSLGTGSTFYVDSNVTTAGDGTSWTDAVTTLDAAVALCTADRGDIIRVAQGHTEDWTTTDSADLDMAGITVIGEGQGEHRPLFTLDDTDGELVIGDASIMITNLRFLASVDSTVHIIEVEDDADGFIIHNCEFMEPESANTTDEVDDCIEIAAGANQGFIVGCTFYSASAGAATAIDLAAGVIEDLTIAGNLFIGDWSTAAINSDDIDLRVRLLGNVITNTNATGFGAKFSTTASGWCIDNIVSSESTSYMIDPGSMFISGNKWIDQDSGDVSAVEMFTNETGVDIWSASQVTQIQTAAEAAIAAAGSIGLRGTAETNTDASVVISADLDGFGDHYFNSGWSIMVMYDSGNAGVAPAGQVRDINDYVSSTGTFYVGRDFAPAVTASDEVWVFRVEAINPDDHTILGSSGEIWYVSSRKTGIAYDDPNTSEKGTTMETAFTTIALAEAVCGPNDVIYVASGHNENIGVALEIDVAGVSVIGMGEGDARPLLDFDTGATEFTLSAAGITLKNLRLRPGATDVVAGIVVGNAADGSTIENCAFITGEGSDEEFRECITVGATAINVTVRDCTYDNASATAADQDTFINLAAGTIAGVTVEDCTIFGTFFIAPIYSNAICTNVNILNNTISNTTSGEHCIEFTAAATGVCAGNRLYSNDYATMLDPGFLKCIDNWGVDASDQQAIRMPISAETTDVTADDDGSDLERLEYLQGLSSDILAGMRMAGYDVGDVFYCDSISGNASGAATSWDTAETIIADAYGKVTASVGDIVFVAPGHSETISASTVLATAGVTVIGLGENNNRPLFTMTATLSDFAISGADNIFDNLRFYSTTAASTAAINIAGGGDRTVIRNCSFTDNASHVFTSAIALASGADGCLIEGNKFVTGADSEDAIDLAAGVNVGINIEDNYIYGSYTLAAIHSDEIDTSVYIKDNEVVNTKTTIHAIEFSTTATGQIIDNILWADTKGSILDPGSIWCYGNYASGGVDSPAYLVPEVPAEGLTAGIGNVWYCDDGGSNGTGKSWATAKTTLKAAEALASAGDTIYIGQNHDEEIAAAGNTTFDTAGITVIGKGTGDSRPLLTLTETTSSIILDAAGVTLRNLRIQPGVTVCAEAIRVEDEAVGCVVEDCSFIDGDDAATDEFVDVIQLDEDANDFIVRNCDYFSSGTETNTFLDLEETTIDNTSIIGCTIVGQFLEAAIWGGAAVPTNVLIKDNVVKNTQTGQFAVEFSGNATGMLVGNKLYSDDYTTLLDPGYFMCIDNWAVDIYDEAAIPIPLSAYTADIEEGGDGSDLERLEYLQNKSDDILANLRSMGGTVGDIWYVDDGGGGGDGDTWADAETTLAAGYAHATANVGDIVFVAPAHDEVIGDAAVTFDTDGVTVIGIGDGTEMPEIEMQHGNSSLVITATGATIKGIKFYSTTASTDEGIWLSTGSQDFTIEDCLFTDVTGNHVFTIAIRIGADGENCTIRNCRFESTSGNTGATSAIAFADGVIDRLIIEDCHIWGDFDNGGIYNVTNTCTNLLIRNNSVTNNESGDHAIEIAGACTGDMIGNKLYANTWGSILDPGSMKCYENYAIDTTDESARLVPAASTIAGQAYTTSVTNVAFSTPEDHLFDVDGGDILITSFVGIVTELVDSNVATCGIEIDRDDEAADTEFTTLVAINDDVVGTVYVFTDVAIPVLTPLVPGAVGSNTLMSPWFCPEGMIEQANSAANLDGTIVWHMTWIPYTDGTTVTAQ